ncbi:MAG: DUF3549 family protein [Oceanobacter sp.]
MTIGELLAHSGAEMRVFEMGRRIQQLDNETFADLEAQRRPFPVPYLKHAWLGILSWNPNKPGQHGIWFLKLPLDEQNLIQTAERDAFVRYCSQRLASPQSGDQGEAPFSFKPDPHRMAYFHALASLELGAEPSRYYTTARAYLSCDIGWENWQQLGLQGLAEVVANNQQDNNEALLTRAIPYLPVVPLRAVLGFMENMSPGAELTSALNDRLAEVIKQGAEAEDLTAFVRALSHSQQLEQRRLLIHALLAHPNARSVEFLAALSSRCWMDLEGDLLIQFLETLVVNEQGDQAFATLIADLMTLPGMRQRMLAAFSHSSLSNGLRSAIESLLNRIRGGQA